MNRLPGYKRREAINAYIMLAPWIIGFIAFTAGPMIASIVISFMDWPLLQAPKWIGFENYKFMFKDELFWISLYNTIYYTVIGVPLRVIAALCVALAMNLKLRGISVYRTIYYVPSITPAVASSIMWLWIFNPDLDGNILWEIGEPSSKNALVTNDLPFQVYDIDGDGNNEVVCIRNFEIQILDGKTGKIKEKFPAPRSKSTKRWASDFSEDIFYRIAGDSIMFCNVSGREEPRDILIKDRYHNAWVFNNKFDLLWEVSCNTGHYPCAYDVDGDGKDEILIGYTLFDDDGSKLWELPDLRDHADGIVIADIDLDGNLEVVIAGGDDGIMITDINGNILMKDNIGHAQTPSVAKFLPEIPGLQICTITFWKYPGTICIYDAKGNRLKTFEIYPIGSPLIPVNWKGDGQEYILFSGDVKYGGLFDGAGRRVLSFPDDGHPSLCCTALDLIGDARDEIVLWDTEKMYIYTQDTPFEGDKLYTPKRNPLYNESNYKGIISL